MRSSDSAPGRRVTQDAGGPGGRDYGREHAYARDEDAYGADHDHEPAAYRAHDDPAVAAEYGAAEYGAAEYGAAEYGAGAYDLGDTRRAQYAGTREAGPEPARGVEYARSRTRGRTATATRNGGSDTYSGYPTAARLLGISPPPSADELDDAPEPGKWERSGRLQSWLEDAEHAASPARAAAIEEVEELEAGVVMPARAMQARRAPAAPLRPVTRNNARKALPWERRAAEDGYPQVRAVPSGRRTPPALVATLVLLIAAVVLFSLPSMLPLVAGQPRRQPVAQQPPASSAPLAVAPTATPEPEPTEAPPAAPTPRIYRVRTGDNLSGIAERFNVTVKQILDANPDVTDPRLLRVGQRLTIPTEEAP